MKSYATLGYRNLSRRKSRSALTVAGIMLAIGFTVGLLSISEGFIKSINGFFGGQGPEIYIMPKNVGGRMPFRFRGLALLDQNEGKEIERIDGVWIAEPVALGLATESSGSGFHHEMTTVAGVPAETFFKIRKDAKLAQGQFYKNGEWRVTVLGSELAESTGKKIGDNLELVTGAKLQIIGILEKGDNMFDRFAYAPMGAIQDIFSIKGHVTFFMVKLKPGANQEKTVELIKKKFPDREVKTMDDLVEGLKRMTNIARLVHLSISSFALMIGVLFVACTMLMSVSERIREFATLRAIGASKGYVVKQIVTESVMLSLIGGAAGCLFGFTLSQIVNFVARNNFKEENFITYVSPRIVLAGLVIAAAIGIAAAIFPAIVILKKNIADSLRYE